METTHRGVTDIISAGVLVLANDGNPLALAVHALVKTCAGVAILTASADDGVDATVWTVACICSTGVGVITVCRATYADSGNAMVSYRAGVIVVAAAGHLREDAETIFRLADPGSTWITILAVLGHTDAVATDAEVTQSAEVAVIARQAVGRIDTSAARFTGIGRARV